MSYDTDMCPEKTLISYLYYLYTYSPLDTLNARLYGLGDVALGFAVGHIRDLHVVGRQRTGHRSSGGARRQEGPRHLSIDMLASLSVELLFY